jgi:hypothetical protein
MACLPVQQEFSLHMPNVFSPDGDGAGVKSCGRSSGDANAQKRKVLL